MTAAIFRGESFSRTHENQAFDKLGRFVSHYWKDREERVVLIGNVTCNAHELDALLLKPDAIVIIDFKNFGGRIEFTENGPWFADGQVVKGGSKANPFKQIQANKFGVLEWLEKKFPSLGRSNNLGHIAGLVLFQQSIEFDASQLPGKAASWFHVEDFTGGLERLTQLASPGVRLSRDEQDVIVTALNVTSYQLPDERVRVVDLPDIQLPVAQEPPSWTANQRRGLELAEVLLAQDDPDVLLITGMASTGKTALVQGLAALVQECGRDVIMLGPNAALASRLSSKTDLKCRSLFGHIYDFGAAQEDEDGCLVHPRRASEDAPDAVYFIDEAHLVGDAYFDLGGERFGSGHTVTDFLEFATPGQGQSKLIVLGDPHQLSRGGDEHGLHSHALLESKGLKVQCHVLDQLVDDGRRSGILDASVDLVSALRAERFSTLAMPANTTEIISVDENDKGRVLRELFAHNDRDAVVITPSNQSAKKITSWIRRKIRGYQSEFPQPEDRIELYSSLKIHPGEDNPLDSVFVPHGSYGTVVDADSNPIEHLQPLRGRDQPISLRFRRISVRFDYEPKQKREFLFFEPFLLAERPELDEDTLVALRVYADTRIRDYFADDEKHLRHLEQSGSQDEYRRAKLQLQRKRAARLLSDPYYNAARIRYAYACTCHHAQGRMWEEPIINADYEGQARSNQGYFRWLYTALTRAATRSYLVNFAPLSPLDGVQWKPQRAVIDPKTKSLFRLQYPKDGPLIAEDLREPVPSGLTTHEPALVHLWLHVKALLAAQDLEILEINQYPYQEHYVVVDRDSGQATIALRYNGQYDVTAVGIVGGDERVANIAVSCLYQNTYFEDPLAQQMYEVIREHIEQGGFLVEGGMLSSWHFRLTVADATCSRATIKVHYMKEGRISTVEAEKATDAAILEDLGQLFRVQEAMS